jgi:hypothetical protein
VGVSVVVVVPAVAATTATTAAAVADAAVTVGAGSGVWWRVVLRRIDTWRCVVNRVIERGRACRVSGQAPGTTWLPPLSRGCVWQSCIPLPRPTRIPLGCRACTARPSCLPRSRSLLVLHRPLLPQKMPPRRPIPFHGRCGGGTLH